MFVKNKIVQSRTKKVHAKDSLLRTEHSQEVDRKWKRVVDYVSGLAACVTRWHSDRQQRRAVFSCTARGRPRYKVHHYSSLELEHF